MKLIYNETVQGKTCCIVGHSMGGALAVHLSYLVGNSGLGSSGFYSFVLIKISGLNYYLNRFSRPALSLWVIIKISQSGQSDGGPSVEHYCT